MNVNRSVTGFLAAVLCYALLFPPLATADRGIKLTRSRIALVIGNGDYKNSPLKNPVNDASDMADALKKLGFLVTLKTNATQRTMEESIRDFGRRLTSGGVGLFYYAGHGIQVQGRNYLIPIGAQIKREPDVKYEAVDAGRVLAYMEDAGNNLNIIILDACRDNPFARSFRSSEMGLARMDAPTGSLVAYATSPGSVAADGLGRNGLYTSKLLKHMVAPGITIERALKNVRIEVAEASNRKQIPWESSSLMGDFYFEPGDKSPASIAKLNTDQPATPLLQKKELPGPPPNKVKTNPSSKEISEPARVVILPWRFIRDGAFYKDALMVRLIGALERHHSFEVSYSNYPVNELPHIYPLPGKIINKVNKANLWEKTIMTTKPNLDAIYDIARQLECDSAVIGIFDVNTTFAEYLSVFYIDINSKTLVKYKESNLGWISQGALSNDLTIKLNGFVKEIDNRMSLSKR